MSPVNGVSWVSAPSKPPPWAGGATYWDSGFLSSDLLLLFTITRFSVSLRVDIEEGQPCLKKDIEGLLVQQSSKKVEALVALIQK